jgi:hypothetical protein
MLIIIHGSKRERLTQGWLAAECLRCQTVRPFVVEQIHVTKHIYFVETSTEQVAAIMTCDFCGTTYAVDPDLHLPTDAFWTPQQPLQELVDKTAPQLGQVRPPDKPTDEQLRALVASVKERASGRLELLSPGGYLGGIGGALSCVAASACLHGRGLVVWVNDGFLQGLLAFLAGGIIGAISGAVGERMLRRRKRAAKLFAEAIERHGLDLTRIEDLMRTDGRPGWLLAALYSAGEQFEPGQPAAPVPETAAPPSRLSEPAPDKPAPEARSRHCSAPAMPPWKPGAPYEPLDPAFRAAIMNSGGQPEAMLAAAERCRSLFRPALKLVGLPRAGYPRVRSCRIGGHPDLPAEVEWPRAHGQPLGFLAQINLAVVRSEDRLELLPPDANMLYFFMDLSPAGDSGRVAPAGWRVLACAASADAVLQPPPHNLARNQRLPGYDCRFSAFRSLPAPGSAEVAALGLGADVDYGGVLFDPFRDNLQDSAKPDHRLLGHPAPGQSDIGGECVGLVPGSRPEEWQLLLQVDSDPRNGTHWGNEGRLCFMIRREDLLAARFDQIQLIMQGG